MRGEVIMAVPMHTSNRLFLPARDTRMLLIKWVVALIVPLAVFNFVWQGDALINNVILGFINPASAPVTDGQLVEAVIFIAIFYLTLLALAGYLVAADSGRRGVLEVWIDILIFTVVPILLIVATSNNLILGLALCGIVWPIYFILRRRIPFLSFLNPKSVPPPEGLRLIDSEQRAIMIGRARAGGFWFGTSFAVIWLFVDLIFFLSGQLPTELLVVTAIRTVLLPLGGYFLGQLGGMLAVRRTLAANGNGNHASEESSLRSRRQKERQILATSRASEETRAVVPNDLPLRSTGARNFFLILLVVFVVFYPVIDPFLFGSGTAGRLSGYNDAGYYVILALGLNIVVGFAGLLDLGYVAFFAIGSYTWGIIGSTQLTNVLSLPPINSSLLSGLFWPMVIGAALIAAFFGVLLGAPTLRLRGDYLAIVTLGFGEIVPIV